MFCKYFFFPVCGLSFYFLNNIFRRVKTFGFSEVQMVTFFLLCSTLGVIAKKSALPVVTKFFSHIFFY